MNKKLLGLVLVFSLFSILFIQGVSAFSGSGSGTEADPYVITDWYELNETRDDLTAYYELGNDLNSSTSGYSELASETANGGKGWNPNDDYFDGDFDGQGFEIKDLYINRTSDYLGLFGKVGGSVHDVGVINVSIMGNSAYHIGALIGDVFDGTVTNCYSTGKVIGDLDSAESVGGLIGSTGSSGATVINNCFSSASVEGYTEVGGLIGDYEGSSEDNYALGNVECNGARAGGFIGRMDGSITTSYSSSSVSGTGVDLGGFVGYEYGGTVNNSYWDIEASGQSTSAKTAIGLNTSEMTGSSAETNMNFDFTNTWETLLASDSDVEADGYPILQNLNRTEQIEAQELVPPPNTAPDAPSNPSPSDGATAVSLNPALSVDVSDPDEDSMDVSFYDASDDSSIATDLGVANGGTASVTWSGLSAGTSYSWYAVADDGSATNTSDTWSFTTHQPPSFVSTTINPASPITPVEDSNVATNITATLNNDSGLDTCTVNVKNPSDSVVKTVTGTIQYDGGWQCFAEWNMEYWRPAGTWDVNVTVNDTAGLQNSTTTSFTYDSLTALSLPDSTWSPTVNSGEASTPSDYITVKNTGNQDFDINITGSNLVGESDASEEIPISNLKSDSDSTASDGTILSTSSQTVYSTLTAGSSQNQDLWFYIDVPIIKAQTYSTTFTVETN